MQRVVVEGDLYIEIRIALLERLGRLRQTRNACGAGLSPRNQEYLEHIIAQCERACWAMGMTLVETTW